MGEHRRKANGRRVFSTEFKRATVQRIGMEPALKAFKKLMLKDGLFQEMKQRAHYEKPSVKRKQALAKGNFARR